MPYQINLLVVHRGGESISVFLSSGAHGTVVSTSLTAGLTFLSDTVENPLFSDRLEVHIWFQRASMVTAFCLISKLTLPLPLDITVHVLKMYK